MELASLWCINARWLLEEYEGLGGKNSLRMCTHHIFTVFYSLIFSILAASAWFCTLSLFLQFPQRWFYHGVQMSSSAQQSQKRQSAKMIVRNEQNIGNLLVFLLEESHHHIHEWFLLQIAPDIKSGNSVVMILQDRTFHQISKLGQWV